MVKRGAILIAAALSWGAASLSAASFRGPFPPPSELRAPGGAAAGDMLALALGARRLFADIWFIRLMQYYGTREFHGDSHGLGQGHEGHSHHLDSEGGVQCDHGAGYGKGDYPLFHQIARHVLEVDPSFTAAGLYGAASLAFNLDRAAEAEELLRYGLSLRPREWKYLTVLAAVGYSRSGDPSGVAGTIAPLLKDPDCPVMLKQLAAFLNKKAGNYAAAAAIYADILATSRDQAYVANARRELDKLSRGGARP